MDDAPLPGLPAPPGDLVGREREAAALARLLGAPGPRLIVLTGTAGVGKTALAHHVAHRAAPAFAAGARLVPLADLRDPELVLPTIARALGLSAVGPSAEVRLRVLTRLRGGPFLLVLDNFEHLLAAAPVLADLRDWCPDLRLLVTSRAALRLRGQRLFPLDPLPLPDSDPRASADELRANPAVALFLRRAGEGGADPARLDGQLAAVAEICRRLDGLPLAIELAAARARSYPPVALLPALASPLPLLAGGPDDHPPRLRSLEAAIAWSYDLLDDEERQLFRRLAVFEGGFTLRAARAITRGWTAADGYPPAGDWERYPEPWWAAHGREPPAVDGSWTPPELAAAPIDVVVGLDALVAHSLVRPVFGAGGEERFELLQTIRDVGRERLEESGEADAVRHAHAAFFLAFAEACALGLWGADHRRWRERLEFDLGNVRAARRWLTTQPGAANQLTLRLAETLWPHWQLHGIAGEGRAWLAAALAREGGSPRTRANALNLAGLLAWYQGDDAAAQAFLDEALQLARAIDWGVAVGRNLFFQGLLAWRKGDFDRMEQLGAKALTVLVAWDDYPDAALTRVVLAVADRERGRLPEAAARLDQAAAIFDRMAFPWGLAVARFYAGEVARDAGDRTRAAALLRDALDRFWDGGDRWGAGGCVAGLALLVSPADPARAARLLGAAEALVRLVGAFLPPTEHDRSRQEGARLARRLGPAFEPAYRAGLALSPEAAVAEARALAAELLGEAPATPPTPPAPERRPSAEGERLLRRLTPKQREVFRHRVSGKDVKAIALELGKSKSTVYGHLAGARTVFGVKTDAQLVRRASDLGLL